MKIYDKSQWDMGELKLKEHAVPLINVNREICMNDLLKIKGHLYTVCIRSLKEKLIQKGWDNEFADLDQDVHRKVVLNFEDINTGIGMSIIKPFFNEEYICKDCLCPTCKSKECRNTNCGWCFNRKTVECNDYRK